VNDRKHVVVGLFVLAGLILLGVMIVWFEGVSDLIRGGYHVRIHLPTAMGVRGGKRVHMDGIEIGDVLSVASSQPAEPGVWVTARINPEVRIPRNARFVAQRSMTGDIYLDFQTGEKPEGQVPTDGSGRVRGHLTPPSLLPEDLMTDFRLAMQQFKNLDVILANIQELTEPRTLEDLESGKRKNLWTAVAQFENTTKTVQDELAKPDSRLGRLLTQAAGAAEDLRTTLKRARDTLDQADKALATVSETGKSFAETGKKAEALLAKGDALMAKLSKDADAANALITNLNGAVTDLRDGKGTAGKLLTDAELHRALVTLVENLRQMADNADRLITMWRKEGILSKEGN